MKQKLIASIIFISCLAAICKAQTLADSSSLSTFVNNYFKNYIGKSIASISVVFVQGDSVILEKSLGYAKPGKKMLADPHKTVYQIGSNSKLFVATAAMQLYEQGKLDLNADINKYLKDFQLQNNFPRPVTMAELLTHTSGVEDRKLGRTQLADQPLMTLGKFFQKFPPHVSLLPGDQFNYSGNAISLAAHVIEEISGETFYQYVEKHIYPPLQMYHSSFRQPLQDSLLNKRAAMLSLPLLIKYPEGGMASTVEDMSHFLIAHLNSGSFKGNAILQSKTEALMQSRHFSTHPTIPGVGYGFFEANINGYTIWMHTGDYQHTSVLCIVPEKKFAFFLVLNQIREIEDPVLTGFVRAVFTNFFPSQAKDGMSKNKAFNTDLQQFVGYYCDNSIPKSNIEKFLFGVFFGQGDARVLYDKTKDKLIFEPPGTNKHFELTQTDTLLFTGDDGRFGVNITFRKLNNKTNLFISAGPLGQYSMEQVPWFLTQTPQFLFHLIVLFLFGVWLMVGFFRVVIRHFRKKKLTLITYSRYEKLAFLNLSVVAILADTGFVLFSVLGSFIPSAALIVGIPSMFKILPIFYKASCITAIPLVYFVFKAWKDGFWKIPLRVLFTIISFIAILFIPFCLYWNLFGLKL